MNRTIIHIGMPRAASTFFQQEVFPQVQGFLFKGVDFSFYSSIFQKIQFQDDSYYDEEAIRSELIKTENDRMILSNELLVGQSLNLKSTNRTRTARRLKALFPEAEIVLFLRNQLSLIQSLYAIGVYDGLHIQPEAFFHDESSSYPSFERNEIAESYKYLELVKLYESFFERVEVFLFEDFKEDAEHFVSDFSERLNIDLKLEGFKNQKVNRSLGERQIKHLRRLNMFKPILGVSGLGSRTFASLAKFIEHSLVDSKPFSFDHKLSEKIKDYYAENNRELGEHLPHLKRSGHFKKYY